MSKVQESQEIREERLYFINPFIFSSETDGRFWMFIVGLVVICMFAITSSLGVVIFGGKMVFFLDLDVIYWFHNTTTDFGRGNILSLSTMEVRQKSGEIAISLFIGWVLSLTRFLVNAVFVILALAIAYILSKRYSKQMIMRQSLLYLRDFYPSKSDTILCEIDEMSRAVGIQKVPRVFIKLDEYRDAQVFGFMGDYMVKINVRSADNKDMLVDELDFRIKMYDFRVMLLHEFAHIFNQDIDKSYFSSHLWSTCIFLFVIPNLVLAIIVGLLRYWDNQDVGVILYAILFCVRGILSTLFIRAIYHDILRNREFYADFRVNMWGYGHELGDMLSKFGISVNGGKALLFGEVSSITKKIRLGWERIWNFHTPAQERYVRLVNPLIFFKISYRLSFMIGVLFSLILSGFGVFLSNLFMPMFLLNDAISWFLIHITIGLYPPVDRLIFMLFVAWSNAVVPFGVIFVFMLTLTYVIGKSLGDQIQRAALVDIMQNETTMWSIVMWKVSCVFILGLELGLWLIPGSVFTSGVDKSWMIIPVWWFLFTASTWLWTVYVRVIMQIIVGTHTGDSIPYTKMRIVSVCSTIALWLIYVPMIFGRSGNGLISNMMPSLNLDLPSVGQSFLEGRAHLELTLGFVVLSMILFIGWFVVSVLCILIWRSKKCLYCPKCKQKLTDKLVLGRRCSVCYDDLASWIYIQQQRRVV
jgi:Zn-dependent protease with chaperone function